jgi:hypothetical protein
VQLEQRNLFSAITSEACSKYRRRELFDDETLNAIDQLHNLMSEATSNVSTSPIVDCSLAPGSCRSKKMPEVLVPIS